MDIFPVGYDVKVTVQLIDVSGQDLTSSNISYRIEDENEASILGDTVVTGLTEPVAEVTLEIPASLNNADGLRNIILTAITPEGKTKLILHPYALLDTQRLTFLENSFQTYNQALLLSAQMPDLTVFMAASANDRQTALAEAFNRLTRIYYRVNWEEDVTFNALNRLGHIDAAEISPSMWAQMTEDYFDDYPEKFRTALKKAQIAEANDILTGDPIGAKSRAGLLSETVGESSMMFKNGVKPLKLAASRAALEYLKGFVDYRVSIGRA
jgi:hypothetical protein